MLNFTKNIYNPETMLYEVRTLSRPVRWLIRFGVAVFGVLLLLFYLFLYTSVFGWDLPKTASVKRENARLESKVELLSHRLDQYERVLEGIERRDDDVYRSIFGLRRLSGKEADPVRNLKYEKLDEAGASQSLKNLVRRMDAMSSRVGERVLSLSGMNDMTSQVDTRISHIPAVPPVRLDAMVHISSNFGRRTDPVFGGRRFHEGQDFASFKGNKVYATGDAVVEKVQYQFFGYGNMIVLDHGFGYKTRYAHLKTILVQEGQKVLRGEQIGELGNSGKSTGPHLHYEVLYLGNAVNPSNYYDMQMNVEEFDAMVKSRAIESARTTLPSTGELLRNRKR